LGACAYFLVNNLEALIMKRILLMSALLLSSPAALAETVKSDAFWAYVLSLGSAASEAVSTALNNKKLSPAAVQALQEAYEKRIESVLKKPAEAAKIAGWQEKLEQLLNQSGALENALVQEERILAQVTTPRSPLNIRAYPNQDTESLGKAEKGALVEILKKTGDWYQIRGANGVEGYATGQFITIFNDCRFGTVSTPRSPLNIRSAKNSSSRVLGKVEKGGKVCVLNTDDSWFTLKYKGQNAYAAGQYIRFGDNSAAQETAPKAAASAPKAAAEASPKSTPKTAAAVPKTVIVPDEEEEILDEDEEYTDDEDSAEDEDDEEYDDDEDLDDE
jgi:uncharacterized protein YgiM (DUF1202 family)